MSMETFFWKVSAGRGNLFPGHDLLIDIPVLTQFLCEAFKWSWKYGQTSQARRFFLFWCVQFPIWRPSVMRSWQSSLLCHDLTQRPTMQWHQHTRAFLFICCDIRPPSQLLEGKRCIFPETSHRSSGCCWVGWQHVILFIVGKLSF